MHSGRIPRLSGRARKLLDLGGGVQTLAPSIVSDPRVCGGVPVFKGTRITVWDVVVKVVALDCPPDAIVEATGGAVTLEAIEEAKQLIHNSPETPDDELLVCASSEFHEGPDHFAARRTSAHVPASRVDRSWLRGLLELEAPKRGVGRLLAIDPDVDPYMPVIRGSRLFLKEIVDWMIDPSEKMLLPRHWALTAESFTEIVKIEGTLLHLYAVLEGPSFDKEIEERDRELNAIKEHIRQAYTQAAESQEAEIAGGETHLAVAASEAMN